MDYYKFIGNPDTYATDFVPGKVYPGLFEVDWSRNVQHVANVYPKDRELAETSCGQDKPSEKTEGSDILVLIPKELYNRLKYLGIIGSEDVRGHNVGESNYAEHLIQPWAIWLDYPELSPWEADIIKRVLRKKNGESRKTSFEKIKHICDELIRQEDEKGEN